MPLLPIFSLENAAMLVSCDQLSVWIEAKNACKMYYNKNNVEIQPLLPISKKTNNTPVILTTEKASLIGEGRGFFAMSHVGVCVYFPICGCCPSSRLVLFH